ncbi:MAG: diacylglycerol kinase family lipid kinase [Chloroflexi bacterium]|nr:diacylglycerol kinase family lipid kinase [Chloroflexota bacterium]
MASTAKTRLIVNPVSANGKTAGRWPPIQEWLRTQGLAFDHVVTERSGHATELARQAVAEGCTLIVAVGGEGTLNEVVNGLVSPAGTVPPEVVLGIIPSGTGTDFVRTLGIPRDCLQACQRLLRAETIAVDLGEVEFAPLGPAAGAGQGLTASHAADQTGRQHRYFINVAGLGFDGEAAERVNRSSKALGGTITYLISLFITLVSYQNKHVELTLDGQTARRRLNSVIVSNGCYFGGGMRIAPHADLQDGLFDVIILGDLNKLEFALNVPKVYNGTHLTHPKVEEYRAREVRVVSQERMLIQADGELVGMAPATFRLLPQAIRVKI